MEKVMRVLVVILLIVVIIVGLGYLPELAAKVGGFEVNWAFSDFMRDFYGSVVGGISGGLK